MGALGSRWKTVKPQWSLKLRRSVLGNSPMLRCWLLATDLEKPWPLWTWLQPQQPLSLPLASYILSDPREVLSIHNSGKRPGGLRPGCEPLNSNGSFLSQLQSEDSPDCQPIPQMIWKELSQGLGGSQGHLYTLLIYLWPNLSVSKYEWTLKQPCTQCQTLLNKVLEAVSFTKWSVCPNSW